MIVLARFSKFSPYRNQIVISAYADILFWETMITALKIGRMPTEINMAISTTSEYAQSFKALGDETRLKMIGLLTHGELCVCDFMEVLRLPQSTASRHLAYLKNCKWVMGRRSGKWMYYKLNPDLLQSPTNRSIVDSIAGSTDLQHEYAKLLDYLRCKDQPGCT